MLTCAGPAPCTPYPSQLLPWQRDPMTPRGSAVLTLALLAVPALVLLILVAWAGWVTA